MEDDKGRIAQGFGRRRHPLPEGVAPPPRHMAFSSAELVRRFVSSDSGQPFAELADDSRDMCTWRCPAGHEYLESRVSHRHSRGCSVCATSVATRLPDLLRYWDSDRNPEAPTDISAYSREPCHWVCANGHHFERAPYRVIATGHQCVECRREGKAPWRIAGKRDNSATLADLFPEIAAEWDRERNPRGPEEYAPGSQWVAHWICPNGHSWSSPICHRTSTARHRATCQACKAIAYVAPELAAELHPTLNPEGTALRVRKGSNEPLFWLCERGHTFTASVAARLRANYPAGCETCRSVALRAPELIAACWAWERNGDLDPETLRSSSADEVWWVRIDCLDVPVEERQPSHYELKRVGYRYRRYVNNPEREVARIHRFLQLRREASSMPESCAAGAAAGAGAGSSRSRPGR